METVKNQTGEIANFNFDHTLKIASFALEKAGRLADLNLVSAKVALEQSVESADAFAEVKDFEDLLNLRAKLAETSLQYATTYSKSLYQVMSQTQADFSALMHDAWTAYATVIGSWAEESARASIEQFSQAARVAKQSAG